MESIKSVTMILIVEDRIPIFILKQASKLMDHPCVYQSVFKSKQIAVSFSLMNEII
jgi:hypothetical protein